MKIKVWNLGIPINTWTFLFLFCSLDISTSAHNMLRAVARRATPLCHCVVAVRKAPVRRFATGLQGSKLSDFDLLATTGAQCSVQAYDPGGFVINAVDMRGSVLVFPNFAVLWDVWDSRDITIESLAAIEIAKPTVGAW